MQKLTVKQKDRVSEILGNIAVAWFTAGVITPLMVRSTNPIDVAINLLVSLSMFGAFFYFSVKLAERP